VLRDDVAKVAGTLPGGGGGDGVVSPNGMKHVKAVFEELNGSLSSGQELSRLRSGLCRS